MSEDSCRVCADPCEDMPSAQQSPDLTEVADKKYPTLEAPKTGEYSLAAPMPHPSATPSQETSFCKAWPQASPSTNTRGHSPPAREYASRPSYTSMVRSTEGSDVTSGHVTLNKSPVVLKVHTSPLPDPPAHYLVFTALVTSLCNPLVGGVALYKSLRCKEAIRGGQQRRSEARANEALLLGVLAFIIGISVWAMTITIIWVRAIWRDGI